VVGVAEVRHNFLHRAGLDDTAERGLPQRSEEDTKEPAEFGEHQGDPTADAEAQRLATTKARDDRQTRRGQHGPVTSYEAVVGDRLPEVSKVKWRLDPLHVQGCRH